LSDELLHVVPDLVDRPEEPEDATHLFLAVEVRLVRLRTVDGDLIPCALVETLALLPCLGRVAHAGLDASALEMVEAREGELVDTSGDGERIPDGDHVEVTHPEPLLPWAGGVMLGLWHRQLGVF